MRRTVRTLLPALALVAAGTTAARAQYQAFGLTTTNGVQQLVRFNTADPATTTVLGATGQNLTGLDFRPVGGALYAFDGSSVFTVNTTTGAATMLGSGTGRTVGGNVGFDFNPTVDRIRLTGTDGTNLRLNPNTGGLAATDGAYTYAAGDVNAGQSPSFAAVAYTNSDTDPATGTMLFGIDQTRNTLVRIMSPNGGSMLTTVGTLGAGVSGVTGFDIVRVGASNVAFFTTLNSGVSNLYRLDLTNAATSLVGTFGGGVGVQGLAIAAVPEPGTWALLATGLLGVAGVARRRRSASA